MYGGGMGGGNYTLMKHPQRMLHDVDAHLLTKVKRGAGPYLAQGQATAMLQQTYPSSYKLATSYMAVVTVRGQPLCSVKICRH